MPDMDEALLLGFSEIEHVHWWFVTRRHIVEQAIGTDITDGSRILEVGCGTGDFLRRLRELFPHAIVNGVEPSDAAVQLARRRGCSVACGTLEAVPSSGSYPADLLVALDVLEHCEDDGAALQSAVSAMSVGGRLVLTVPALPSLWSPHDDLNRHYRRYTAPRLARALAAAGLEIERLTYFNTLLLPAAYLTRLASRLTHSRTLSGVELPSRWVNTGLTALFSLEVGILRHIDLPVGMSLLAVARKPNGLVA